MDSTIGSVGQVGPVETAVKSQDRETDEVPVESIPVPREEETGEMLDIYV